MIARHKTHQSPKNVNPLPHAEQERKITPKNLQRAEQLKREIAKLKEELSLLLGITGMA